MAKTLNPPKQVTCGNTSQSLDVDGQSFIWVGGEDVESVSNITECVGMTAWPRYELVLPATSELPIFAVKKFGGSSVEARILEVG